MASNPPFQVEDNTDEDFFDKLVNDDDVDFRVTSSSASVGPSGAEGNESSSESDESKAFANLSIEELDSNGEVSFDRIANSKGNGVDNLSAELEIEEQLDKVGTVEESVNPTLSSNSFEFDNPIKKLETKNAAVCSDAAVVDTSSGVVPSDATIVSEKSGGSGPPEIKEVDWSVFHADSAQNDSSGFGSYSDFFKELGENNAGGAFGNMAGDGSINGSQYPIGNGVHGSACLQNSNNYGLYSEGHSDGVAASQSGYIQDINNCQNWENQYPGWKYDPSTRQWYQVDGYDGGASVQANDSSIESSVWGVANGQAELSYFQQTSQSVSEAMPATSTTETVNAWNQASQVTDAIESTTDWNQVSSQVSGNGNGLPSDWSQASPENNGYPPHMVFDPQYPDWYYDTISQEWRTLESYTASAQTTAQVHDQMYRDAYASNDTYSQGNNAYSAHGHDHGSQRKDHRSAGSFSNYSQQSSTMWLPKTVASSEATSPDNGNQLMENQYGQHFSLSGHGNFGHGNQQNSFHYGVTGSYYENLSRAQDGISIPSGSQGLGPGGNLRQYADGSVINQNEGFGTHSSGMFSQQQIQNYQISDPSASGRSSAGRPAHALVAFGFGGKLVVMKDNNTSQNFNFGNQNPVGGSICVLNLAEVVNENVDSSSHGMAVCNYFQALSKKSAPGPLTSGSVGTKELNKWIDERIASSESPEMDYRKAEVLKLLLSLLKIACQHCGKLRSYGTEVVLKDSEAPESAVAKLFASAKRNGMQNFSQYGDVAQCLQKMPSEGQMRATATEVQNLLVSGRKHEALQCAQEGHLWGLAIVLAAQLGDLFYAEAVKQMSLRQLVAGSPLRTLCLLIAGQPANVFSVDSTATSSLATGVGNLPPQPLQFGANGMLDDWEENLAVITANRTKDDELVLIHLGDCLWKERHDIIAAHICYLVADANFEPYSDSARLCLVGADHWKFPRTYASPDAIQRTEIYEYSKTLGNSQFVLRQFQPYKLIYAHMLAEVGRIAEASKYCQAILKSLNGRTPEVETLRHLVSSLEERIKAHQQGGFSTNAPKEFLGKLLNLFDSTAHRVVGGLPPSLPTAGGTVHGNENQYQSIGPRISASQSTLSMSSLVPSQSTLAMSSLVPSQSLEPITEHAADANRMAMHTRSVSEPDFGRSPRQAQADSLKESSFTGMQNKASEAGTTSRFGRFSFGSQLLQRTVGLVLKPRQGRQAKLGDANKFYYDEKLKRWVEEGAEPPAEETALPPPPTAAVLRNGTSDYNLKSALQSETSHSDINPEFKSPNAHAAMPPLPPASNQYSARGRIGVRSRYVDTFNQGTGNAIKPLQSPSVPSVRPASGVNPKFFVPQPVSTVEQPSMKNNSFNYEDPSTSPLSESFQPPDPSSSVTMQRFASMNNISNQRTDGSSFSMNSRRTASWSGSLNEPFSPPQAGEAKTPGQVLGVNHPSSFTPSNPSSVHSSEKGGSIEEELHEVEF